ncbi:MAG TPA: hypothetical protein VGI20_09590, partial [Rhizomicrobium sp.]
MTRGSPTSRYIAVASCMFLAGVSVAHAARDATVREKIVLSFDGKDGNLPNAGLVADAKGNLYGTTSYNGGANGYGNVFELSHTKSGWK